MIETIDGMRDEAELRRVDITNDNDNEQVVAVEYWDGDRLVHRSAAVTLKQGLLSEILGGSIG